MKIHLDTDLGGDIDDLCALALLLARPDVEITGITSVAEHDGRRAGYVRHALGLAGREGIRVAAGADARLAGYREWPGLPDEARYWPQPPAPTPGPVEDALDLLEQSVEQGATVLAIGPFTNLRLLDERRPRSLRSAPLVLMGGYVYSPRLGFPRWGAEMDYNVQVDVRSARHVLEQAEPLLVTLAVTAETALRRSHLERLRQAGPLARLIAHQAEAFAQENDYAAVYGRACPGLPGDIVNFQHDPLAAAIASGWREGVEIEAMTLRWGERGGWLRARPEAGGRPARVVTRIDGERFSEWWVEVVTAIRP